MTQKEREIWIAAIRMDAQAIRAAVSNIYAQMAVITTALNDLEKHQKLLESS